MAWGRGQCRICGHACERCDRRSPGSSQRRRTQELHCLHRHSQEHIGRHKTRVAQKSKRMRAVFIVVLGTAAIATAQVSSSGRGADSTLESRQGFPEASQTLPTQPLFQLPLQQQLLLSGQSPFSQLQQPSSGLQSLGAQGLSVPLALNRQGLAGQLYGLGGQGLGPQLGQGLVGPQLGQGLVGPQLGQGLVGPRLQGLRQGLLGAQLQGFPGAQLQGLGGQLSPIALQKLRRQGLASALTGLNRPVDLSNGIGGQKQLTQGLRGNQLTDFGVNPLLGRRAGNREPLTDLIQLANIFNEDDFPSGGSSPLRTQGHTSNRLAQHEDIQDDELTLLLETLSSLRTLPSANRQPVDAVASLPPRVAFPPPLSAGFGLPSGVFPSLSHRTGLGDDDESASNSVANRRGTGRGRLESFYLGPDRTSTDLQDQFRFPNTR